MFLQNTLAIFFDIFFFYLKSDELKSRRTRLYHWLLIINYIFNYLLSLALVLNVCGKNFLRKKLNKLLSCII